MDAEIQRNQFMIVKKEQEFRLKYPLQRVLGFEPMFNNTCVILGFRGLFSQTVAHYDSQGCLLKQHVFRYSSNFFSYVVPSDREIIWLDIDRDLILQWNLETDQLLKFPFLYSQDAQTHQIFIFPETKLVSIVQSCGLKSNNFRLVYYKYPLVEDSEPVYTYQSEEIWTSDYTVKRANTSSMVLWWTPSMKNEINFRTFQLILKDGKYVGQYRQHKVKNQLKSHNGTLLVSEIWQMVPKKYLISSIIKIPHVVNQWQSAFFVYEEKDKIFREAKFSLQSKLSYNCSFGTTAMIARFELNRVQPIQSPVYYIDNIGQQIAAVDKGSITYKNKFSMPGYDPNVIVNAEYDNANVDYIKSTMVKVKPNQNIRDHYQLEVKLTDIVDRYAEKIDEKLCQTVFQLLSEDVDKFYKGEERKYQADPLYEYQ